MVRDFVIATCSLVTCLLSLRTYLQGGAGDNFPTLVAVFVAGFACLFSLFSAFRRQQPVPGQESSGSCPL
jgi:hypothetical protein